MGTWQEVSSPTTYVYAASGLGLKELKDSLNFPQGKFLIYLPVRFTLAILEVEFFLTIVTISNKRCLVAYAHSTNSGNTSLEINTNC